MSKFVTSETFYYMKQQHLVATCRDEMNLLNCLVGKFLYSLCSGTLKLASKYTCGSNSFWQLFIFSVSDTVVKHRSRGHQTFPGMDQNLLMYFAPYIDAVYTVYHKYFRCCDCCWIRCW